MKKYIILLIGILTITGCSPDIDINVIPTYIYPGTTNGQGQSAIAFEKYSSGQTRAIANSNSGTGYDEFKFYGWNSNETVIGGYDVSFVSPGWTYVGINDQELKYFDNFINEYEFIGIIPKDITQSYNNGKVTVTGVEAFTVDNPYEPETNASGTDTPKEFLYSYTSVPKANYSQGVGMNFVHGNSKVYLGFTSDDDQTEIIDYYPGTTTYKIKGKPFSALGPSTIAIAISDEDMEYINDKYTSTGGWISSGYSNDNEVTGDLETNMWTWLLQKYPSLRTINLQNWGNYTGNENMRLIHIIRDGNNYKAWFINRGNTQLQPITTTGVSGIVVLPAVITTGTYNRALGYYPTEATAVISSAGCTYTTTKEEQRINLSIPTGKIGTTAAKSPTVLFAIPNNSNETGFTVKFSFIYRGTRVYDARVWIPAEDVRWEQGKYYTYIINIKGRGNGNPDPNNIEADDPTIPDVASTFPITVTVNVTDYINGGSYSYDIK